jgi:hypothetical protein
VLEELSMHTDPKAPLTQRPFEGKFGGLQSLRVVRSPKKNQANDVAKAAAPETKIEKKPPARTRSGKKNKAPENPTVDDAVEGIEKLGFKVVRFPVTHAQVDGHKELRQRLGVLFTHLFFRWRR